MTAGLSELLLLAAIILGIFFLPRMTARSKPPPRQLKVISRLLPSLTGRQRLAIVISVFWPIASAVYLAPWQNGWRPFTLFGAGPVILFWSLNWVAAGYRNRNK